MNKLCTHSVFLLIEVNEERKKLEKATNEINTIKIVKIYASW